MVAAATRKTRQQIELREEARVRVEIAKVRELLELYEKQLKGRARGNANSTKEELLNHLKSLADVENDFEGHISALISKIPMQEKELRGYAGTLHVKIPQLVHDIQRQEAKGALKTLSIMEAELQIVGRKIRKALKKRTPVS